MRVKIIQVLFLHEKAFTDKIKKTIHSSLGSESNIFKISIVSDEINLKKKHSLNRLSHWRGSVLCIMVTFERNKA